MKYLFLLLLALTSQNALADESASVQLEGNCRGKNVRIKFQFIPFQESTEYPLTKAIVSIKSGGRTLNFINESVGAQMSCMIACDLSAYLEKYGETTPLYFWMYLSAEKFDEIARAKRGQTFNFSKVRGKFSRDQESTDVTCTFKAKGGF